ncbi:MAG TPA: VOC family protein [Longimicrobium sp.]|jgi:predicted enzyme related to lactoylglutathione lyase
MIDDVKLMGVCVGDQQRAVDFYTGKLGFDLVVDEPMGPGARWIEVAPPGSSIRLGLWTPPGLEERIGTFSHIVFRCGDVRATWAELRDRGVEFIEEPRDQPGGVMAQFRDPDGNIFVLSGAG